MDAGRSSFEVLPGAEPSTNAILGLRYGEDDRLLQAAVAAPLSSENLLWGALTARDRPVFRSGRWEVGADLSGHGHAQRDPVSEIWGWGLRAEALPLVSASQGPVVAELRSGGSFYRAETDGAGWSRGLWTSDARVTSLLRPGLRVSGEARHLQGSEDGHTFVGLSASGWQSRVGVDASVGEWVSGIDAPWVELVEEDPGTTAWRLGARVSVAPGIVARASVRKEPFDPLSRAMPRTTWGIGVSYSLGSQRRGPPSQGPEFRSSGASTAAEERTVVLHLPLEAASSPPSVAGEFSDWEPIPMDRHGHRWRVELTLEPGVYRYAFRGGDDEWFVPEDFPGRRDDGMGGHVAVLVVE